MRTRRATTLIEFLAGAAILALLLTLGISAFTNLANTNTNTVAFPQLQKDATDIVNRIATSVRRAGLCTSGGTVDAAVQSANSSSISVCVPNYGNCTVGTGCTLDTSIVGVTKYFTYSVDGSGNFSESLGTLPVGGSVNSAALASGTVSLNFQYCLSSTSSYNVSDYLDDTTNNAGKFSWVSGGSLPLTASQLKQVMAVKITATVTRSGRSASYTTTVRLRNSPKRVIS